MRKYAPFLLHQLARFGVLTVPQMLSLCQNRCKKSSLYTLITQLKRDGLVIRTSHPMKIQVAYCATRDLYALVYGDDDRKHLRLNPREFDHSLECAEAFIELSRYANVTGVATERELSPEEVRRFCYGRVPDGIVQITRGALVYELAVEVEHSKKSGQEVGSVLSHYRQTLLKHMPCAGVLIVAGTDVIFERYRAKMAELPKDVEERVLLVKPEGLRSLNPVYFGERAMSPRDGLEKLRFDFQGRGKYAPPKGAESMDFEPIVVQPKGADSQGGSPVESEVSL